LIEIEGETQVSAAVTLWAKHMTKIRRHREEAFGLLLQPILWVVLFGIGMQAAMGPGYIAFMVPGIITLSALSGSIAGGSTLLDERLRGITKEYLVAPIPRLSILMGNALSTVNKGLLQAFVILIVGLLMGASLKFAPLGWIGGFLLVAGYSLGFAGIALGVASVTDSVGGYHALIFILNLPLLFASNALFPLASLSANAPVLEIAARLNPTTYVVDGLRQLVFEDAYYLPSDIQLPLWQSFAVVGIFAAFGVWFALRMFNRSLR
jgi:ABC-2 type transport system permease protein